MVSKPSTAMPNQPPSSSQPFLIPWKCLDDSESVMIAQKTPTKNLPKAQMTFAQALTNVCDTPSSQLPKPSMCSSCQASSETTFHLFFECNFATKMWSWLASLLNTPLQFSTSADMWSPLQLNWTPQCKVVITAFR